MTTKTGTAAAESAATSKSESKAAADDAATSRAAKAAEAVDTGDSGDKSGAPSTREPRILEDVPQPAIGVRARQFPSLFGAPEVEVAERTIDHDEDPTSTHVKDFVTVKRDWDEGNQEGIHERNIRAVRQYMVNQGLRPDSKVEFAGEQEHPWDPKSIVLRYTVGAVPAVVATDFDLAHTVVSTEDETATERAEFDAAREQRIADSRNVMREGTVEADRSNATSGKAPKDADARLAEV